jgi:uncharacterized protein YjiS (DUF1127 family)
MRTAVLRAGVARRRDRDWGRRLRLVPMRALAAMREWRRRSQTRAELARFDARMLADIGLTPTDAWREINKPFWRE